MNEKIQEIIIIIFLIALVFGLVAWQLPNQPVPETEQARFGKIIESTWNQEFNQEKELTFPWID